MCALCIIPQTFSSDSDDEKECKSKTEKLQCDGQPQSYYHTNAMTIYNDQNNINSCDANLSYIIDNQDIERKYYSKTHEQIKLDQSHSEAQFKNTIETLKNLSTTARRSNTNVITNDSKRRNSSKSRDSGLFLCNSSINGASDFGISRKERLDLIPSVSPNSHLSLPNNRSNNLKVDQSSLLFLGNSGKDRQRDYDRISITTALLSIENSDANSKTHTSKVLIPKTIPIIKMVSKNSKPSKKSIVSEADWQLTASNYDHIHADSLSNTPNQIRTQKSQYLTDTTKKLYGSSGDLRSYGLFKSYSSNSNRSSGNMSNATTEGDYGCTRTGSSKFDSSFCISRSRSVEGDNFILDNENEGTSKKGGLWTDTETITDKECSDSEDLVINNEYVLGTTAYVCNIIDNLGLTEEERSSILMVVARDERLRLKEKQRIL